jgi:periplasmic divalent cation tolerance protein
MAFDPRLVFVIAPGLEEARALARLVLEKRLAACVNLVPGIESHYWWQGKLERAGEVMLVIKSSAEHFDALGETIALHHAYACPEVVAVAPDKIAPTYRQWWGESLGK